MTRQPSTHLTTALREPSNYLANRPKSWRARLRASGHTVKAKTPRTGTGKFSATFVPQPKTKK